MTEQKYYRQCELHKGNLVQVAWIPETLAKKGKILRIKDIRSVSGWDDGWVCHTIGTRCLEEDIHSQEYKHHRKRTDI